MSLCWQTEAEQNVLKPSRIVITLIWFEEVLYCLGWQGWLLGKCCWYHPLTELFWQNWQFLPPLPPLGHTSSPHSSALCWCAEFLFRKEKKSLFVPLDSFKERPAVLPPLHLSLCYSSPDKTTDPYLYPLVVHKVPIWETVIHRACNNPLINIVMIMPKQVGQKVTCGTTLKKCNVMHHFPMPIVPVRNY